MQYLYFEFILYTFSLYNIIFNIIPVNLSVVHFSGIFNKMSLSYLVYKSAFYLFIYFILQMTTETVQKSQGVVYSCLSNVRNVQCPWGDALAYNVSYIPRMTRRIALYNIHIIFGGRSSKNCFAKQFCLQTFSKFCFMGRWGDKLYSYHRRGSVIRNTWREKKLRIP